MKLKRSQLQLVKFDLLELQLKCVFPDKDKKKINMLEVFDDYDVNLDFALKRNKENKNLFLVMTKISINKNDTPTMGYTIFIEGASHFFIEQVSEKDESNLVHYSATGIAFQNLRDVLKNVTQTATFGEYLLPTLDLKLLVDEKFRLQKEKQKQIIAGAKTKKPGKPKL